MTHRLVLSLALAAAGLVACASSETPDVGLESLALASVEPGVVITGTTLAIGGDMPLDHDGAIDGLSFWYAANILQGPGAFVLIADGFEDFSRAMRLKLLRELQPLLLGALP